MLEHNIRYCIFHALELIQGKLYLHARKQFSLISSLRGKLHPEEQPFSGVCKWNLQPSPIRDLQTGWPVGNSNLPPADSPPRARPSPSPPRDHAPGCPSAQCGPLHVTSLSQPAAASPRTPACTGARSNSWGRGGKPGGIWRGRWASSSWAMPCWGSEGCRRGQVAPCSSSFRPREGITNAGGGKIQHAPGLCSMSSALLLRLRALKKVLCNFAIEAVNQVWAAKRNISSLICAEEMPAFFNCADTGLC